jgi:hypothetical protein
MGPRFLSGETSTRQTFPGEVRGTADPSTALPRISCGTWWRRCTSCAFPLQKGAHAVLSRAAWQEIRVRFGRDDKGEGGAFRQHWLVDGRTADPSAALRFGRDDKGEGGAFRQHWLVDGRTAGPSASLRFGRDDKGEGGAFRQHWLVEGRTADPSASLGMTKGEAVLSLRIGCNG